MIILPETITDYDAVVDARDAHLSSEEYIVGTKIVKDSKIQAEASGVETISKGSQDSYDVKVIESNGEYSLDTDIGKEEVTPSKTETPDIGLLGIILAAAIIIMLYNLRKKKYKN